MQGRNPIRMLLDEARRKPSIAALVDRAAEITDEEFSQIVTQLPWQKKALGGLILYRRRQQAMLDQHGCIPDHIEHTPETGFIISHTGPDVFWNPPSKSGTKLAILIKTNELLFVTPSETWMGSTSVGFPKIPCRVVESDSTRSRYLGMVYGVDGPIEAPTGPLGPSRGANPLFRISRH